MKPKGSNKAVIHLISDNKAYSDNEIVYCFRKNNKYGQKGEKVELIDYVDNKKSSYFVVKKHTAQNYVIVRHIPSKYIEKRQIQVTIRSTDGIKLPVPDTNKPDIITKPKAVSHASHLSNNSEQKGIIWKP